MYIINIMQKTALLPIRVDPETRRLATEKAESLGLSVSAYIRMLIRLDNREEGSETRRRGK
jgi:antitoxin component of RelBE/YafQ-DinJ toxin-antitoxin module